MYIYTHIYIYIYKYYYYWHQDILYPMDRICGKILAMTGVGCRIVWGLKEANRFVDHRHLSMDTLHEFFDSFSNLHGWF